MATPDRLHELDRRIAAVVDGAIRDLRAQITSRLRQRSAELLDEVERAAPSLPASFLGAEDLVRVQMEGGGGRAEAYAALRDAVARLDGADSQADLLASLLEAASRFATRTALLLTHRDRVRGWAGVGFGADGAVTELDAVSLGYDDGGWRELAQGSGCVELSHEDCAQLTSQLGVAPAHDGVLVPLVLRDRVAAALYADRTDEGDELAIPALQTITFVAAQALETLPLRQRSRTPTLQRSATGASGLALWDEAGMATTADAAPAYEQAAFAAPPETAWGSPAEEPAAASLAGSGWEAQADTAWEQPAPAAVESWSTPAPSANEPVVESEAWSPPAPAGDWAAPAADTWSTTAPTETWQAEHPAVEPEPIPAPAEGAPMEVVSEETGEDEAYVLEEEPATEAGGWQPATADVWTLEPEPAIAPILEAPVLEPLELAPEPAPRTWEPVSAPEPMAPSRWRNAEVESTAELAAAAPPPALEDQHATVMIRTRPQPQPEPEPEPEPAPPPRPVAAPADTRPTPTAAPAGGILGSGGRGETVEVKPPEDVQGPGWAFATSRVATQQGARDPAHEEARRLARLLVSEIKLYNEEQVEEGRRNRNIYGLLKEDIDRSRQMYDERVDERVRTSTDYFHQELVRILAAGDAAALGI